MIGKLRTLALSFPETSEPGSWGHPNFRAGKKTFCAFEMIQGRPSIAFRLPRAEVTRRLRQQGTFQTPYGRGLWVSVWVDGAVDDNAIARLAEQSYRGVAIKRMLAALDSE